MDEVSQPVAVMLLRVREALGRADDNLLDDGQEELILNDVLAALASITRFTGATWNADGTSTQRYDAPRSSRLNIAAVQSSPTPVVAVDGNALTLNTDYRFVTPTQLERLSSGAPTYWTPTGTRAVVTVLAKVGSAEMEADISKVWEAQSVRLVRRRLFGESDEAGNSDTGISNVPGLDDDLAAQLLPYAAEAPRQITPVGVD